MMDVNQYMLHVNVDTPMWSRYAMTLLLVEAHTAVGIYYLVYLSLQSGCIH